MRVGNETANDQLGIDLALQCVEQVDTFRRLKVPHTTGEWAPAGSELAALLVKLPEGPVDLRLMVHEGLWSAFSCMDEVAQIFRRERGSTEVALMPLLRTALLAASRCTTDGNLQSRRPDAVRAPRLGEPSC